MAPAPKPTAADWRALSRSLDGDVVRRRNARYAEAKQLFDPRFDAASPLAVIEVAGPDDVVEAIRFARKFELPVRAKAGGHSYVGASTLDDGLVIDVARLDPVTYDAASGLAEVGAGAQLYSVHAALAESGRTIPTGTCPTVGAAGLTLGGGIGVDSRAYGLTCDRLRGATVVTADAVVRTVGPDRDTDLYWACRGGGGGNVGVVTSLQFQTHPAQPFGFFLVSFPWSAASRVLTGWARRINTMPRSAWMNLHLQAGTDGSTSVRTVGVCAPGDEASQASAVEAAVGVDASSVSTFQRSFLEGIEYLGGGTTSSRQAFAAGSDVIASMSSHLAGVIPRIVGARAASRRNLAVILDPLTGAVRDLAPSATAFPWRRHLADVQWYISLPEHPSGGQVSAAYDWIDDAHQAVDPDSAGGYVNYLEPARPVATYYGANLSQLRQVKSRYDPTGFFHSAYTV